MIRCGNRKVHNQELAKEHHHNSVDEVRLCYNISCGVASIEEEVAAHDDEVARAEWEAEMGYERHLESRGYWEARADEDHEMAMGIDPFNPLGPAFGLAQPAWIPEHLAN